MEEAEKGIRPRSSPPVGMGTRPGDGTLLCMRRPASNTRGDADLQGEGRATLHPPAD